MMMNSRAQTSPRPSRRDLLQHGSAGFGWLALSALLAEQTSAASSPLAPKAPHFPARAKRVIFLFMQGGPSHVDTFDWKPGLKERSGKTSGAADGGSRPGVLLAPQFEFSRHGKSGLPSAPCFRNWQSTRMTFVSSTACTPATRPIRRPALRSTPEA